MAGFIVSLLAQIGLEDVSGSDLLTKTLNKTTIFYFLPMKNAGLGPGGYLEVMLQQVCEKIHTIKPMIQIKCLGSHCILGHPGSELWCCHCSLVVDQLFPKYTSNEQCAA